MPPGADKLFKLYRAILSLAIDLSDRPMRKV